jgi:stage V sporulation protein G
VDITEVRVRLTHEPESGTRAEKLHAYCSITIGREFVVRDIKIIESGHGLFVAMPSRKLSDRCPRCGGKNHLRARHCNDCGAPLDPERAGKDGRGRARLHADVAHPINAACREKVQDLILAAYRAEKERSGRPGYVPQELHDFPEPRDDERARRGGSPRREALRSPSASRPSSSGGSFGQGL